MGSKSIVILRWIKFLIDKTQEFLFPAFCLGCNVEGIWLCDACLIKAKVRPQYFCPVCYKDLPRFGVCSGCSGKSFLDGAVAFAFYKNEIVGEIIRRLKYDFAEDLGEVIVEIARQALKKSALDFGGADFAPVGDFIVVPVPLSNKRLKERGFNQAEIIAKQLSFVLVAPLDSGLLKRIKNTNQQVGLSREARGKNLIGAFEAVSSCRGKNIILVDDVFTTGNTMGECAKVLKLALAEKVFGVALARES